MEIIQKYLNTLKLSRDVWKWLKDHPDKRKEDWPRWKEIEGMLAFCPLCHLFRVNIGHLSCELCILKPSFPFNHNEAFYCNHNFYSWVETRDISIRRKAATNIYLILEKEYIKQMKKHGNIFYKFVSFIKGGFSMKKLFLVILLLSFMGCRSDYYLQNGIAIKHKDGSTEVYCPHNYSCTFHHSYEYKSRIYLECDLINNKKIRGSIKRILDPEEFSEIYIPGKDTYPIDCFEIQDKVSNEKYIHNR